jgi:indolepyruvate ferredoxin oxidoreductase beta subunit
LQQRAVSEFPAAVHELLGHAIRRLTDFQDIAYATLFLERLESFRQGHALLLETVARHLAVWMSYDDAIRVAHAKIRPERLERIRAEAGAAPEDPVIVTEFLKPGLEEICDILPEPVARVLLALGRRWPRLQRMRRGMYVKSTSLWGYGQLRMLAGLRRWRRTTWRYRREQEAILAWLQQVQAAAVRDARLGLEVAECARLIKGYGETYQRGLGNYRRIMAELIQPALAGERDPGPAAGQIAQARAAALADPEGAALGKVLAQFSGMRDARSAMAAASD